MNYYLAKIKFRKNETVKLVRATDRDRAAEKVEAYIDKCKADPITGFLWESTAFIIEEAL